MPLYSFKCEQCDLIKDELRKMGDFNPPNCDCGNTMIREYTPVSSILKGEGWMHGSWEKIKTRSRNQGKKFFRRHPNLAEKSANWKFPSDN